MRLENLHRRPINFGVALSAPLICERAAVAKVGKHESMLDDLDARGSLRANQVMAPIVPGMNTKR